MRVIGPRALQKREIAREIGPRGGKDRSPLSTTASEKKAARHLAPLALMRTLPIAAILLQSACAFHSAPPLLRANNQLQPRNVNAELKQRNGDDGLAKGQEQRSRLREPQGPKRLAVRLIGTQAAIAAALVAFMLFLAPEELRAKAAERRTACVDVMPGVTSLCVQPADDGFSARARELQMSACRRRCGGAPTGRTRARA